MSKTHNGKTKYADTEKVNEMFKTLMPYDFVITFYQDAAELDDKIKEILMYHELKHVGFDPDNLRYYIIPHDIEDFVDVLKKYGYDWITQEE